MTAASIMLNAELTRSIKTALDADQDSIAQIASRLRLSWASVKFIAEQMLGKDELEKREAKINQRLEQQVCQMRRAHLTISDISSRLHLGRSSIYRLLHGQTPLQAAVPSTASADVGDDDDDEVRIISIGSALQAVPQPERREAAGLTLTLKVNGVDVTYCSRCRSAEEAVAGVIKALTR